MSKKKNKEIVPIMSLRHTATPIKKVKLDSVEKAVSFLRKFFNKDTFLIQEEVVLLMIDYDGYPIGVSKIASGSQGRVTYDMRNILRTVLLSGASSFIMAHNHPSELKYPSDADVDCHFALVRAAKILDLAYQDNIILTKKDSYSMADNNEIFDL